MKIQELLDDHQFFRSTFQMDYYVMVRAGGGTVYGMYEQVLSELYKLDKSLRELGRQKKILAIELTQVGQGWSSAVGLIKREEKQDAMVELDKVIIDARREHEHFEELAWKLKAKLGKLTPEKRERLETERRIHDLRQQLAIDLLVDGNPSRDTIEHIGTLPPVLRAPIFKALEDPLSLVAWYKEKNGFLLEDKK